MKDRCEHGILWSMECLTCPPPEYATATPPDTPVVADWFDLALRYMRGDPALTDVPYSEDSVFADFLRFWDTQTPHFRSVVQSVFQAAPRFTATTSPSETAVGEEAKDNL